MLNNYSDHVFCIFPLFKVQFSFSLVGLRRAKIYRRIQPLLLVILGPLPLISSLYFASQWHGEAEGLKNPEFVPVYDENDDYIGITHPRLVEGMNSLRKKSIYNFSREAPWDKAYEEWLIEHISP